MANARRPVAPAVTAVIAAAAARAAYTALTRNPPGGAERWTRANHRGEPVTLLEGPAAALAGAAAATAAAGVPARSRAALATAAAGAAAFGGYDDIAGSGDRRGFRGHLGALAHGEVTTGAVKIGGIGATGVAAAALTGGPAVDVAINSALIAGSANLLNLFDLRPGRALKVVLAAGVPLGISQLASRPGGRPKVRPGDRPEVRPGGRPGVRPGVRPAEIRLGRASRRGSRAAGAAGVAVPLGAAVALLPEDLGERAMLGDAGANALGAMLGAAAAGSLSRRSRLAILAGVTALTAASEVVSFTKVIQRTPPLHWLDMLGRRPVDAAPPSGRAAPSGPAAPSGAAAAVAPTASVPAQGGPCAASSQDSSSGGSSGVTSTGGLSTGGLPTGGLSTGGSSNGRSVTGGSPSAGYGHNALAAPHSP
jgi:UDP-GlcNAc:undecaprenyl-phosphate/decaprenyl-phosphate GlcNAc-1-phosphate transferase